MGALLFKGFIGILTELLELSDSNREFTNG
jgi:hypothetical protein